MDKYDINFPLETKEQDLKRLINQLWKLIPMRENEEDWINHLNTMIEEISSLTDLSSIGTPFNQCFLFR